MILSRVMLMRKVHGQQLATLMLTSSEYFVLDLMVQNMESRQMEMVSYNFMMMMMLVQKKNKRASANLSSFYNFSPRSWKRWRSNTREGRLRSWARCLTHCLR